MRVLTSVLALPLLCSLLSSALLCSALLHSVRVMSVARSTGSAASLPPTTPSSRITGATAEASTPAVAAATPAPAASAVDPFFHRVLTPAQQSYVREFTSWSVSRLEREPRALAAHAAQLQSALEDLSLSNYPTFLQTHRVMTDAHTKIRLVDHTMAKLGTTVLPDLLQACASFSAAAPVILSAQSSQRLLEKEQSFLLELLEIPQLMDTCFKNQMIHEALQLDLYVKELTEKIEATLREKAGNADSAHTGAPAPVVIPSILSSLKLEIHAIKANIVRSLLSQLRGNITVETGFPIVGLLKRTLDIFGSAADGEDRSILLKYQFLMARNAYFESAIKALQAPPIPVDNPAVPAASGPAHAPSAPVATASTVNASLFKYLDEVLYLNRTNLFDIITLYSALFLDHDDLASPAGAVGSDHPANEDLGLLARWIHFRVEIMLATLELYLPHISDGSSLLALLNSCMEYGARLSRSKVGLDFRPLLPPLFCRVILSRFSSSVDRAASSDFEVHLKTYALRLDSTHLRKMGITALQQGGDNKDKLQTFIHAFLPHPPLAMLADAMIAATNCLAKCAPLEIAPDIGHALQKALATAVQKIKYAQTAGQGPANHAEAANGVTKLSQSGAAPAGTSAADLLELARTFRDSFVPFAHALVLRVYPHAQCR